MKADAPSQRQAASAAAAAKRKAGAMSEAERKAKDAERKRLNRAAKKAKLDAAAPATQGQEPFSFDRASSRWPALGDIECDDFCDWLLDMELRPSEELRGVAWLRCLQAHQA